MSYVRTNWTKTTPINTTNLNNIEEGITSNINIELIGLGEELPIDANEEDQYYIISENTIYKYANDEWISEGEPKSNIFYILVSEQKLYYYNGSTLISVGGGSSGSITIDDVYPVGSIYMSFNSTNPEYIFGGKWQQLSGGYLYGAVNSSGTGNGTGTYTNDHKLTANESGLRSHNHTGTTDGGGNHTHTVNWLSTSLSRQYSGGSTWNIPTNNNANLYSTSESGNHTHTFTTSTTTALDAIEGHSHDIPYIAVFIWLRVEDEGE